MRDEKGNWRLPVEPARPGAAPPKKPIGIPPSILDAKPGYIGSKQWAKDMGLA